MKTLSVLREMQHEHKVNVEMVDGEKPKHSYQLDLKKLENKDERYLEKVVSEMPSKRIIKKSSSVHFSK